MKFFFCFLLILSLQILGNSQQHALSNSGERVQNCPSTSPMHWIFALDESGSMGTIVPGFPPESKWTKIRNLMNIILPLPPNNLATIYTFDDAATVPDTDYDEYTEYSNPPSISLPLSPFGGTDFRPALIRAIDVILHYSRTHTCFVMISDGGAAYPTFEVEIFKAVRTWMENRSCYFCVLCFYIAPPGTAAPPNYVNMCSQMGSITPFPISFKSRTKAAAVVTVSETNFDK